MLELLARLRPHAGAIAAVLLLLLGAGAGAAATLNLWENRLALHPAWAATKPTLERGVMGALAFVAGPQGVARNRLRLDAWFGFQEVLHRDALDPTRLALRFRVAPGGYLHVLYDHRPDGFAGVRFGSHPDFPSVHYRAAPDGEFTAREPLAAGLVRPDVWHRAELRFAGAEVELRLDGASAGRFARRPGPQRVGFRGGLRGAEVDDVVLETSAGVLEEGFANGRGFGARFAAAFAALAAAAAAAAAALRRSGVPARQIGPAVAVAAAVAGAGVAGAYGVVYWRGREYRVSRSDAEREQAYWVEASRAAVVGAIRARYAPQVAPGTFRLLVLGTSQTWGAGARAEEETFVRRLEPLLAARLGRPVECVNAAVSALRTRHVLGLLRRELAGLNASAALVNLANNDVDVERFRRDLDALAGELARRGIPAVFALEPNSVERVPGDTPHGDLAAKHEVVRAVAARHGRPVVDLHGWLAERRDAGFLWWDFVHLTSFGHRLVAGFLADALPPLLGDAAATGPGAGAPRAPAR